MLQKVKDSWFYKDKRYKKQLEKVKDKLYISYSTVSALLDEKYCAGLLKNKLLGIPQGDNIYANFGSYCGHILENGKEPKENPNDFDVSAFDVASLRKKDAEYEKIIVIDRGEYVIIGFIDMYYKDKDTTYVVDMKTGGTNKESKYTTDEYIQTVLYAYAIGEENVKTKVYFLRRAGYHSAPTLEKRQLRLTGEFKKIPVTYSKNRVVEALEMVDKAFEEVMYLTKFTDEFKIN